MFHSLAVSLSEPARSWQVKLARLTVKQQRIRTEYQPQQCTPATACTDTAASIYALWGGWRWRMITPSRSININILFIRAQSHRFLSHCRLGILSILASSLVFSFYTQWFYYFNVSSLLSLISRYCKLD